MRRATHSQGVARFASDDARFPISLKMRTTEGDTIMCMGGGANIPPPPPAQELDQLPEPPPPPAIKTAFD